MAGEEVEMHVAVVDMARGKHPRLYVECGNEAHGDLIDRSDHY